VTPLVNIRQLRLDRGWTLAEAAERFAITEGALSMIERGLRVPGPVIAHAIASAYELLPSQIWPVQAPQPTEDAA
jgi:transcriptional regulator with XRE-family HTH domain